MKASFRRPWVAALVALGAAALYLPQLRDAPVYLNRDEMFFGLTAHALASTGRDTMGRFLPLYFQTEMRYGSEMWFQPMLMYASALSVKALGLSEGTIRMPMALAGVVDVLLVYAIARLLMGRELLAVAAAVLLAAAPAHFINSRIAMDFQMSLPFALGWLLCVVAYLGRPRPRLLLTAGLLLGIGLFTYIAAYMLMPIYGMLTCVVLYRRREPLSRYLIFAAGFLIPASVAVPFLVWHPTILHDVLWHYERDQPLASGAADLVSAFFGADRFARAVSVYVGFWNPRFLFINGPQAMWTAGAFLLPTAGLLGLGVWRAVRRRAPVDLLLLGGLLSAPIPASLVGDGEAIHRAAALLPFGVLLAVVGLDWLWTAEPRRVPVALFALIWTTLIGVAASYHDALPLAQAFVRASTVPLALAAVYAMGETSSFDRLVAADGAAVAAFVVVATQMANLVVGFATVTAMCLVASVVVIGVSLAGLTGVSTARQLWTIGVLAAAASQFVCAYGEYPGIVRVGAIPASAIVVAARAMCTWAALAAATALARALARIRIDRVPTRRLVAGGAVAIVLIQLSYFYVDYFAGAATRAIHAIVVLAVAVGVAMWLAKAAVARYVTLGHVTAAALLGLASLQFGYFYADYFTRYRVHAGNSDPEGNTRVAWEAVIERASERTVPAIYLTQVGPYGFADLYWKFFAIAHQREDLLPRTTSDVAFEPARLRDLPDASLVVTSPSSDVDRAIERMLTTGELRRSTLVTAPDGMSRFWILETGAPTARRIVAAS